LFDTTGRTTNISAGLLNRYLTLTGYGYTMMEERSENEKAFPVECVWCGSKIREDKEEASGVCLKCFYQILSNHLRAQKRTAYGEFVSDR